LVPLRKEVASKISLEARFNRSEGDCSVISNAYGAHLLGASPSWWASLALAGGNAFFQPIQR
jgi:hypothetical protein